MPGRADLLYGWGRTSPSRPGRLAQPAHEADVRAALLAANGRGAVARGLGRAYGDAAQNAGGTVLDMTALARIHELDLERGRVTLDAGVSLNALLEVVVREGWFLPVSPGTKFVTVGGAIACDVHGKNHHVDGAFCRHVLSLDLLLPSGEVRTLGQDADEFWATAGGLGLTGVVVRATIQLAPIESAWMLVDTERATDLEDALSRFKATDERYRYSVAWIDCLARGRRLGRAVLLRANHARRDETPKSCRSTPLEPARRRTLKAPGWVPSGLVNRWSIAAFNEAYFRKAPREERGRAKPLDTYFYPLDGVAGWNALYGRSGFVQYQLVVPFGAEETLRRALERLSGEGCPSFLAVLKGFGDEQGLISFPMRGWTLALDVPAGMPELPRLLDELDQLVADSGGRIYLAKDARLRPDLLEHMYPNLPRWREIRDRLDPAGVLQSDLSRRVGLAHAEVLAA
jgi:decaprenylphospho-beta-D-ribofuranose 2-oxidase